MPLERRVFSWAIKPKNLGTNAETAAMNGRATGVAQAFGLPRRDPSRHLGPEAAVLDCGSYLSGIGRNRPPHRAGPMMPNTRMAFK